MLANLESSAVATGLEKISVQSNPKEGQCQRRFKCTIALILHFRKVMLKVLQARLQQYVNQELPDVQAGDRKGRRIRNQIANIHWISDKARQFQKNIYFCFIDYIKAFDCGSQQTGKFRNGSTRTPYLFPEKLVCGSRSDS